MDIIHLMVLTLEMDIGAMILTQEVSSRHHLLAETCHWKWTSFTGMIFMPEMELA